MSFNTERKIPLFYFTSMTAESISADLYTPIIVKDLGNNLGSILNLFWIR